MHITRTLPTVARATAAQQPTPQPPANAPEPPAGNDDHFVRYGKAAVQVLNGVACIVMGGASASAPSPMGAVYGGLMGVSGGAGYGHVADIFSNLFNIGTFHKKYELAGALVGGAAGVGASVLAAGHPVVGYAIGAVASVPNFLSAVRAFNGLE